MKSNKGSTMASYDGYLMQQTVASADGAKQYWRCATRACHGTAQSSFGKTDGLTGRKPHDRCTQNPMAVVIKQRMTATKRRAQHQKVIQKARKLNNPLEMENDLKIATLNQDAVIKNTAEMQKMECFEEDFPGNSYCPSPSGQYPSNLQVPTSSMSYGMGTTEMLLSI
uniref:FLYWCH-type domain-containing protein n=1 Tax=Ditylenchus dipsaci TaxID=166011 RepID=A0A915CYY8_9BILA